MKRGIVYIMTNRRNGTLYVGTSNLPRRTYEHGEGIIDGFTKDHGLKRLVCYDSSTPAATLCNASPT